MVEARVISSYGSYIELSSPELSWLGESGQPYRGTLYIQFMTEGKSLEMLSLKRYITSLRDKVVTLEDIASKILFDLNTNLSNNTLGITVKTTARGGISSTIRAGKEYSMPESKPIVFGIQ